MNSTSEQFLQAEEEINKILDSLNKLKKETESYRTAKNSLDIVTAELTELIKSGNTIFQSSKNSLVALKEMGGPKILEDLSLIKNEILEKYENLINEINIVKEKSETQSNNIKETREKLENSIAIQGKKISRNFIFLISSNIFALIITVLLIILLVK